MITNIQRNGTEYFAVYDTGVKTQINTYRKNRSRRTYTTMHTTKEYKPVAISEKTAQRFIRWFTPKSVSRYEMDDRGKCVKWTAHF